MTTATTAAPAVENLSNLKKSALAELCQTRLGFTAPKSWTCRKMIEALNGDRFPRSTVAKAQLTASYVAKTGFQPAKSWTCRKLANALQSSVPVLPRGKATKAKAIADYVAKTGQQPAKTWTTSQIVENTASGKLPGGRKAGVLTADACKKLLAAARKNGTTVPAYSALKADALRELVASLKLS